MGGLAVSLKVGDGTTEMGVDGVVIVGATVTDGKVTVEELGCEWIWILLSVLEDGGIVPGVEVRISITSVIEKGSGNGRGSTRCGKRSCNNWWSCC